MLDKLAGIIINIISYSIAMLYISYLILIEIEVVYEDEIK